MRRLTCYDVEVLRWAFFWPEYFSNGGLLNPFRAPEPLPILNPSNFVPKNGFPVVKGYLVGECRSCFDFFFLLVNLGHGIVGCVAFSYFSSKR